MNEAGVALRPIVRCKRYASDVLRLSVADAVMKERWGMQLALRNTTPRFTVHPPGFSFHHA